ncbi:hypothetical protein [Rhizobium sp. LjRoot254]|uniref:hypothetical protein n=1 Tax=Rhizobium sp. LjRoot254 TaxID=3342297 RepID=UPI003ECD409F
MIQVHPITGEITFAYSMTLSDTYYVLRKNSSIDVAADYALYEQAGVSNNRVIIKGSVTGSDDGLDVGIGLDGKNSEVWVAETGLVHAAVGVEMGAFDQKVTNYGRIEGAHFGIWAQSNGTIRNFGTIFGHEDGIMTGGAHPVDIFNGKDGRTVADNVAVHLNGGYGMSSTLTNEGVIKGGGWAFASAYGDEKVVNHGVMKGSIWMGEGNDTFDNRGGKVDHEIYGQKGNDTLITDSANVHMKEDVDMGVDSVKSTVSYTLSENVENLVLIGKADINGSGNDGGNVLTGNKGDNRLAGLGGADILNGARGNDIMTGGADGDVFLFAKGGGHDIIRDFTHAEDHVDLSAQDIIADFDDMIANHVTSSHGDLTIHVGNATLILENTKVGDLDFNDFYF